MHNQRSSLVAAFSLLVGITGCAVEPGDLGDELENTGSVEQHTYRGDLGSAVGEPVTTGITIGATNDFSPSCVSLSSAPDVTYTWTSPSPGAFEFNTIGASFDTVLQVRAFNTLTSLGCDDDSGGGLQSKLILTLAAGRTVLIVVDGWNTAAGTYRLSIRPSGLFTDQPTPSVIEPEPVAAAIARKRGLQ